MSEVKQVKVDNWGIYFLQRLKHFFNRTDYCDLTLQFQDNAQLKVHRLVLSACTEYFELLERTCEMYEDCLVMPDDLQADVVVPIINFMYTGQLEFKVDLLEKLYQTSLIMNMPVLTKLLSSHRNVTQQPRSTNSYYGKRYVKQSKSATSSSSSTTNKRAFSSAFSNTETPKSKKTTTLNKVEGAKSISNDLGASPSQFPVFSEKNSHFPKGARPTRYELPEELEEEMYDNSFTSISYTSKPLMVHPDSTKQYRSKKINLFEEGSSTSRFVHSSSSNDIVECKKITSNNNMFLDESSDMMTDERDYFHQSPRPKEEVKDSSQLFDQIIENDVSNITIETTKNKQSGNLDHAKIISEVLKKYPHLVKSNKQIKLKILNTASSKSKKLRTSNSNGEDKEKIKNDSRDFTYETDVIDSKEAARLIALGAENVKGPWICLICGTPGKALHFTSYYNFRKHLVEVHNEKPVPNICEYCGLKSQKRNYLVHHQLTKHGVEPPSHYNFPKCNYCDYVALNEALLVKHKITHTDLNNYKRNICNATFAASLMDNMQKSTNKQTNYEKKNNLMCMYCLRVFLRQNNLYAHLKTSHKEAAKNDGLIYDSESENQEEEEKIPYKGKSNELTNFIKVEVPVTYEYEDVQYQLERRPDGNIHVVSKKPRVVMPKHKILNPGFVTQHQSVPSQPKLQQKAKPLNNAPTKRNEYIQEICLSPTSNVNQEEIVVIDNNEYIVRDYQLYPKNPIPETKEETLDTILPTTSMEFHNVHNQAPDTKMFIKKSANINQPLQIVVSNEEEYKTLLNSNQSVIYDERDSGKTLTVLASNANNNALQANTIDLNNTQANEMMILPENFSINVSETVAADNSNIVVVYSHPVEDPNKQYQLITAQEVGVEFVQSSQILTQTFETVTTCSSVGTSQSDGGSWPGHLQATISKLPITSAANLQTIAVAESVTVPCEAVSSHLNDYQGVGVGTVALTSAVPLPMVPSMMETQHEIQANESNMISNIEQNVDTSSQPKTSMVLEQPMMGDNLQPSTLSESDIQSMSVDSVVHNTVMNNLIDTPEMGQQPTVSDINMTTENPQEVTNNDPVSVINKIAPEMEIQHTSVIENIEPAVENAENASVNPTNSEGFQEDHAILTTDGQVVSQMVDNVANVVSELQNIDAQVQQEQISEEFEEAETIENIAKSIAETPNPINNNIQTNELQTLANNEIINNEDVSIKKTAIDPIQSLTSEWSEDEGEVAETAPNCDSVNPDKAMEVEESIENIQQEVARHSAGDFIANTEIINSLPDVNMTNDEEQTRKEEITPVETPIIPNEKISSLLHDWDDQDSQEESSVTENKVAEQMSVIQNPNTQTVKENVVTENFNKNDKIKSLVSDWDEDDDNNKD